MSALIVSVAIFEGRARAMSLTDPVIASASSAMPTSSLSTFGYALAKEKPHCDDKMLGEFNGLEGLSRS